MATTNSFLVLSGDGAPSISSFTPTNGWVNSVITIAGANFVAVSSVALNGSNASFTAISPTQITATVPTGASTGLITVTTPYGVGASFQPFVIQLPPAFIGTLAGWDVSGQTAFGPSPLAPTTNAANLTIIGLTRGAGVTTSPTAASRAWGGNGFEATSSLLAVNNSDYATFAVMAAAGYKVSFSSISKFNYRRSGSGAPNGLLQYQVGTSAFTDIATLAYTSSASGGSSLGAIDLSAISALQNVNPGINVTFRIVNWGASNSGGNWYIYDSSNSSDPDFAVQGAIAAISPLTAIQSWRQHWFGSTANSGLAADTAINSADGMPNLLKYALGLDPFAVSADPTQAEISTGHLRLTVPKNPTATDLSFHAELTTEITGPWTTNGTSVDQNTSTLFQAHDNTPVSAATRRFFRFYISRP